MCLADPRADHFNDNIDEAHFPSSKSHHSHNTIEDNTNDQTLPAPTTPPSTLTLPTSPPLSLPPPLYHPSHLVPVPHSSVKGFSAYIDDRPNFNGSAIYVLGIVLKNQWKTPLYGKVIYLSGFSTCLGPSKPKLCCGPDCNRYIHYTTYDTLYHIFQLPPDKKNDLPTTIYLGHSQSCSDLSESIKIYNYRPKTKVTFGVCVQSPLYGDIAQKLVQFIEMNRILGAERITVYSMVKGLEKQTVLKSYQTEHLLDIIPWPKDFKKLNPVHYYGEVLAIHDCLYRNMYSVDYLVFIDLDELIVPRESSSWKEMIDSIKTTKPDVQSFMFLNTYFLDGYNNTKRDRTDLIKCEEVDYFTKMHRAVCEYVPGRRSKYIVQPTAVNSIDIHAIPSYNKLKTYVVPYKVGSMFHYRKKVTTDCNNQMLLYDPVMLKFEQKYLARNPRTCKTSKSR